MTNIKKIGLSALAGALAMTSAHAGTMAVTGSMEVSYTKGAGYVDTGNPLGMAKDLSVTGSTELDNGITVAYSQSLTDANAFDDSELVFGNIMGGTLAMQSTGSPMSAIDDKTPTANKAANGMVGSITDVNGADGDYGIRYTLSDAFGSGLKLDTLYVPRHGTGDANGDEASSGAGAAGNKDAYDITLSGDVPGVEGLSFGAGWAHKNYDIPAAQNQDRDEGTVYLTYAFGGFKIGAQQGRVSGSGLGTIGYRNNYYGISYQVSDDLSISYNTMTSIKGSNENAYVTGLRQDFDSLSLSYTVGGMTIGVVDADCSNCSYTAARSQDATAVSLSVAF